MRSFAATLPSTKVRTIAHSFYYASSPFRRKEAPPLTLDDRARYGVEASTSQLAG